MSLKNNVLAIPLSSFDSAGLTTSYQVLNTGGLDEACTIIRIVNDSSRSITLSYDGITDHEYVQTTKDLVLNFQTNSQPQAQSSLMRKGTVIWIKAASAGTGLIYLSGYYNPQH